MTISESPLAFSKTTADTSVRRTGNSTDWHWHMRDEKEIYAKQPDRYEELVSREDHDGNILPALESIRPLAGCEVVEIGAGTGRLTRLLIPIVKSIRAFDVAAPMLQVAARKLRGNGHGNWSLAVGSHRALPVENGTADLLLSGWSVCYTVVDNPDNWRSELAAVIAEAERVLKPGGAIILLETMGVGHESPSPPSHLVPYFDYLEENGFSRQWIRTDFKFDSPEQAVDLTRFFFGDRVADKVAAGGSSSVPECTGIWWRRKTALGNR
jgi:ubiquinone/menaquinone biosynthesis C-methylase UbiE